MLGDTGGDGGLGFQLAMYRTLDAWDEARAIREAGYQQTAADFYLAQYIHLVGRYNALLQANGRIIAAGQALEQRVEQQNARIVELENAVKAFENAHAGRLAALHKRAMEAIDLHQEIARLRERLRSQET